MTVLAAVMTGPGTGAIATIQLFGDSASSILRQVFVPTGGKPPVFEIGHVLLGHIVDDGRVIDQVTVGCEGPRTFSIHCHGNPLIVEAVVSQLQDLSVEVVSAERLLSIARAAEAPCHPIAVEAGLALTTVKSIAGAALINNQVREGLTAKALHWQKCLDSTSLDIIRREASQVLADSHAARLMIEGCVVALVGPPNTGKSTLLNALAGREKAIVTDVKGTTRDWVSADIHIPPLAATVIDTAGLDPAAAAAEGAIARAAQEKSVEILQQADLVLLVLDGSQPAEQLRTGTFERLADRRVVVVLNKTDLPACFPLVALPGHLHTMVHVSAKRGTGIADLIAAIHQACGVDAFDLRGPVAFTPRHYALLGQLSSADSSEQAGSIVTELLHGCETGAGQYNPVV
jgi:tRNA modification GTPase